MSLKRFIVVAALLCAALSSTAYAQRATLFSRLGGEPGVTALVSDFYNRLVSDSLLADRFAGPDRGYIQQGFIAYIEGLTGGPPKYRGRDMASVHRHLRVSSEERDHTLVHLQESLDKFRIEPATQQQFMALIYKLRRDVVRDAVPQVRTLYERLGGEEQLKNVVDDWFDRLVADPDLGDRFTGTNLKGIKYQVFNFLGQIMGGTQQYSGQDMRTAHRRMHITAHEWNKAMGHLRASLAKYRVAEPEQQEVIALVSNVKNDIIHE